MMELEMRVLCCLGGIKEDRRKQELKKFDRHLRSAKLTEPVLKRKSYLSYIKLLNL